MVRALCCLALAVAALGLAPALASANANVSFDPAIGILNVVGDGAADDIRVTQGSLSHIVERVGGGLTVLTGCTGGGADAVVCPRAALIAVDLGAGNDAFSSIAVTVPESIAGGDNNDTIRGGGAGDVLAGGDGNDTLDGGGGVDDIFGERGDDTISSRDSLPERIACGAGTDSVENDFTDILAECERGIDTDGDGFASTVDCNDANAAIHPGAAEIFGNGVDEDCNGRDDVNRDADRDGFPVPIDCDDTNPAIRPGALEVRGNAVDENCDRRADPWAVVAAAVTNQWALNGSVTRLRSLVVRSPRRACAPSRATSRRCRSRAPSGGRGCAPARA
jgi:hypothetical protein